MDTYEVLKPFKYCENGIDALPYDKGDIFRTNNPVYGLIDVGFIKKTKVKTPEPEPEAEAEPEPEKIELDTQARNDIESQKKLGLRKK